MIPNLVSSTNNRNDNSLAGASALQIQLPSQASVPVQLPDQTSVQTMTKAAFAARVQSWTSTLEAQSAGLQGSLSRLSSQITALQQQIQDQTSERDRLTTEYSNAQHIYSTLQLKLEEVKISSSDLYGNTQIASAASAPIKPDSRDTIRITVIGLVVSGLLSMIAVLVVKWWKSGE